jgi:hypothetical protein
MRPSDKDTEVFDLDELFNQYVETDILQLSDSAAEPSGSDELARIFELPLSNESDPIENSPRPDWDPSTWHKALNTFDLNLASPTFPDKCFSIYRESRGRASQSDPQLFQVDGLFERDQSEARCSLSTPSTPKPPLSRPEKKAPLTADRSIRHRVDKPSKNSSTFSKMMRPSHFRANIQDLWTRRKNRPADAFSMGLPSNGLSSPPLTSKVALEDKANGFFPRDQPYTIAMSPNPGGEVADMHQSNYQLTPPSPSTLDMSSRSCMTENPFQFCHVATNVPHHGSDAALSALQTPPASHRLSMTTWNPDTPTNLEFEFSASPDYQSLQNASPGWWNSGTTAPTTQPSTPAYTVQTRSHSQNQGLAFSTASVAGLGCPFLDLKMAAMERRQPTLEQLQPRPLTFNFPSLNYILHHRLESTLETHQRARPPHVHHRTRRCRNHDSPAGGTRRNRTPVKPTITRTRTAANRPTAPLRIRIFRLRNQQWGSSITPRMTAERS